jgi:hypothetical protein
VALTLTAHRAFACGAGAAANRWQNGVSLENAMSESRPASPGRTSADTSDSRRAALRELGARAHQVRAATRAADHFMTQGTAEDRDTGSWLMSSAVGLAADVAADIDGIARSLKDAPAEPAFAQSVQALRVRAHQLHAAARAADHFLDQDSHEDRDTGSWLIACARGLAEKLAAEIDDGASQARRGGNENVIDANDAALLRRVGQATAPVRGVA